MYSCLIIPGWLHGLGSVCYWLRLILLHHHCWLIRLSWRVLLTRFYDSDSVGTPVCEQHTVGCKGIKNECRSRFIPRGCHLGVYSVYLDLCVFLYTLHKHPTFPSVQELCESRGGRPGLSVLTSLLVSVDVKLYWTMLRHWSQGGGDSSVVRAPNSWLKGRGFESLLERRENFLLQGRLSVLTLISVSVPPPCYHSST